jgi:hypothetical protein
VSVLSIVFGKGPGITTGPVGVVVVVLAGDVLGDFEHAAQKNIRVIKNTIVALGFILFFNIGVLCLNKQRQLQYAAAFVI